MTEEQEGPTVPAGETSEPVTPAVIEATAEALALLPPIPVDPPKRKPEKVTSAYRFENEDVWRAVRSDGCPFLNRTLPGAEGWIREGTWPTGPDGLPVSMGAMIALGIPEPPGGALADVYVAPQDGAVALRAVVGGKNMVLALGSGFEDGWQTLAPSRPGQDVYPGPDVGVQGVVNFPPASVRVQRIRQARAEGREI